MFIFALTFFLACFGSTIQAEYITLDTVFSASGNPLHTEYSTVLSSEQQALSSSAAGADISFLVPVGSELYDDVDCYQLPWKTIGESYFIVNISKVTACQDGCDMILSRGGLSKTAEVFPGSTTADFGDIKKLIKAAPVDGTITFHLKMLIPGGGNPAGGHVIYGSDLVLLQVGAGFGAGRSAVTPIVRNYVQVQPAGLPALTFAIAEYAGYVQNGKTYVTIPQLNSAADVFRRTIEGLRQQYQEVVIIEYPGQGGAAPFGPPHPNIPFYNASAFKFTVYDFKPYTIELFNTHFSSSDYVVAAATDWGTQQLIIAAAYTDRIKDLRLIDSWLPVICGANVTTSVYEAAARQLTDPVIVDKLCVPGSLLPAEGIPFGVLINSKGEFYPGFGVMGLTEFLALINQEFFWPNTAAVNNYAIHNVLDLDGDLADTLRQLNDPYGDYGSSLFSNPHTILPPKSIPFAGTPSSPLYLHGTLYDDNLVKQNTYNELQNYMQLIRSKTSSGALNLTLGYHDNINGRASTLRGQSTRDATLEYYGAKGVCYFNRPPKSPNTPPTDQGGAELHWTPMSVGDIWVEFSKPY